jgi:hypothetical protein
VLNTRGTFPEFVRNVMITDDAICAHKETKKRKVVATPFGSDPLKYRMVYHHGSTYQPRQLHQHRRMQQQWPPSLPQCQHQRAAPKALPPPPPVMCHPHHRPLEPPPTTHASTVVARATLLESAPRQRRLPRRATSSIYQVVLRRWSL